MNLSQSQSGARFVSRQRAVNLSAHPVTVTSTGNRRLAALYVGARMPRGNNGHNFTEDEIREIKQAYRDNVGNKGNWLTKLAESIGRPKPNICRYAREHGLTDRNRRLAHKPHPERRVTDGRKQVTCVVCGGVFWGLGYKQSRKTCGAACNKILLERNRKDMWKKHPHPRGMLGKHHSPEFCREQSQRSRANWADPTTVFHTAGFKQKQSDRMSKLMTSRIVAAPNSIYSRTRKGWVEFESGKRYYFRSGWEMNYAHYLDWLMSNGEIKDWQYEPDTFWFEEIRRGVRSYTPDFKVFEKDGRTVYHEVKGWMDAKSQTKLNRMKKYYPAVEIIVIGEPEYKAVMRSSALFLKDVLVTDLPLFSEGK